MNGLRLCGWRRALALPVAIALFELVRAPAFMNHDVASYLECARSILEGKVPYVDFVDINPPLVMYLHLLPAAVARALPVPPGLVASLFALAFGAVCAACLGRLLSAWPRAQAPALFFAVAGWLCLGGHELGQREHLFVAAYVPFFALRLARWEGAGVPGRALALTVGALAGLTAFLKPHFVFLAAIPELYWLGRRLSFRPLAAPEVAAFWGVGASYLAHFALLPAAELEQYFGRWVPFLLRGYTAYDDLRPQLSTFWLANAGLAAGALVLAFGALAGQRAPAAAVPIGLATLAAYSTFFAQGKGWTYHALPVMAGGLASMVTLGLALEARWPRSPAARAPAFLLAALLLTAQAWFLPAGRPALFGPALAKWSKKGDSVMFLSTGLEPAFPALVALGRRQGCRYPFLFPLPMLYQGVEATEKGFPYRQPAEMSADERRFVGELEEDLRARRPKMVVMSRYPDQACPPGFFVYDYLVSAGMVAGLQHDYRRVRAVPGFVTFVRRED